MAQSGKKRREVPSGAQAAFDEGLAEVAGNLEPVPLHPAMGAGGGVTTRGGVQKAEKSDAQKFIDRLRGRMEKYPEWFEDDPTKFNEIIKREGVRIKEILKRARESREKALVLEVPFFAFNYLIDDEPGYVHGALYAFDSAKRYAEGRTMDAFLEIAPARLRVVLERLAQTGWVVSFTERSSTEHKGFLQVWVERPVASA